MEAVMGLLLMTLGVCHGVETYCDGRQDGAQCYGALGGTIVLHLMDSTSSIFRYVWSNKTRMILHRRSNLIMSNLLESRSFFTHSDGKFMIENLSRKDEGEYTLEIFDSRTMTSERTLHLTVQAPVSSVLLVSECLSQGEMRVSCSSEGGDSPQYSWTLDGHTLTDTELLCEKNTETNNITLKQHVSGQLVCSVRNKVNSVSMEMNISNCGFIFIDCTLPNGKRIAQWVLAANNTLCVEPTAAPTMITETVDHSLLICGVRAAVVILVLIGISVFFAWKKKKYKMAAGSAVRCKREHEENSVMMVEMRSSASELYSNV